MNRQREVRLRTSPLYAPEIQVGAGRHASRRRAAPVDPHAARQLHRPPERRRQAAHPEARGAEGPELRAAPTPTSANSIKVLTELRRELDAAAELSNQIEIVRAQILALDRVMDNAEIMKPARELEQQARRAAAEHAGAAHDRPRPGWRALRRPAAEQDRISRQRPRQRRTSGRPISSSKCRRCFETTYASSRRRWPRWWARRSRRSTS